MTRYCIDVCFDVEDDLDIDTIREELINSLEDVLNKRADVTNVEALNLDCI